MDGGWWGELNPVDFVVYDGEKGHEEDSEGEGGGANQVLISRRGNFGGNRSTRLRVYPGSLQVCRSLPRARGYVFAVFSTLGSIGPRSRSHGQPDEIRAREKARPLVKARSRISGAGEIYRGFFSVI